MTSHALHTPTPLAPLVDEQRLGSAGGQALTGIVGIILAVTLVIGQISLATTKGIAVHLSRTVEHVAEANTVMESVIERAAPSVELERVLDSQAKSLGNTRDAMLQANAELDAIGTTKVTLLDVVGNMRRSSASLATDVEGINGSTTQMTELLGTLPGATKRTATQLDKIATDTDAINAELGAIGRKMEQYGLPRAKGAPTG